MPVSSCLIMVVLFQLTVTSEALDGKTQLLTADDGDKGKEDMLSLCQAWIPEADDDDDDDDIHLFNAVRICIDNYS